MTLLALLEDFKPAPPAAPEPEPEPVPEPALAEEERLASFEKGYGEGYDDATRAADEERRRVGAALAGRLEDLAFTYHEARAAVLREVRALIEAVGSGLMPEIAGRAFGAVLVDALREELEGRSACTVTLRVAPDAVDLLAPIVPEIPGFPVRLEADEDLGEGQAVIGFPDGESEVDMTRLTERVGAAIDEWLADADGRSEHTADQTADQTADHTADHTASQEAAHG